MKLHRHFYVAIVVLAASAALSEVYFRWLVQLGMGRAVHLNEPLASIPLELGDWHGIDGKMEPNVQLKVGAQDILLRTYYRGKEDALRVYIAYFGGVRGTAPHSPTLCLPGAGFVNISSEVVSVKVPGFGDEPLRLHRDLWEKNFEKQVVIWWEYVHGRNVASRAMQRLQWALPAFLGGRRGSVLQVQISLAFRDTMEDSMRRVVDLMGRLEPHIQAVLPVEEDADGTHVAASAAHEPSR